MTTKPTDYPVIDQLLETIAPSVDAPPECTCHKFIRLHDGHCPAHGPVRKQEPDRLEAQAERLAQVVAERNRYWEQVEVLGDVLRKVREAYNLGPDPKTVRTAMDAVIDYVDEALASIAKENEEGD